MKQSQVIGGLLPTILGNVAGTKRGAKSQAGRRGILSDPDAVLQAVPEIDECVTVTLSDRSPPPQDCFT